MRSCVCVLCHALCDLNFSACSIPPPDIQCVCGGGGVGRLGGLDRYEKRQTLL